MLRPEGRKTALEPNQQTSRETEAEAALDDLNGNSRGVETASNLSEIAQGTGLDRLGLDDSRSDGAKAAGRGICRDRVPESEIVEPRRPASRNDSDERDSMFRSCSGNRNGVPEIRADSRKAGTPRLRPATDVEAGEMSAAFLPAIGAQEPPQGSRPSACKISRRLPGRCRPSGGTACWKFATLTKEGIDPRSITPYIANRREGSRF